MSTSKHTLIVIYLWIAFIYHSISHISYIRYRLPVWRNIRYCERMDVCVRSTHIFRMSFCSGKKGRAQVCTHLPQNVDLSWVRFTFIYLHAARFVCWSVLVYLLAKRCCKRHVDTDAIFGPVGYSTVVYLKRTSACTARNMREENFKCATSKTLMYIRRWQKCMRQYLLNVSLRLFVLRGEQQSWWWGWNFVEGTFM